MAGGVTVLAGGAGTGAAGPSPPPPPPQAVSTLIRIKKSKGFMVFLRSLVD